MMKNDNYLLKKNNNLNRWIKNIVTVLFFLVGFLSFGQESKTQLPNLPTTISSDVPKVPQNYTATKVTISKNMPEKAKADFIKEHGADFYYVYTDNKGKVISKEEVAIQKEDNNNAQNKLITNTKK